MALTQEQKDYLARGGVLSNGEIPTETSTTNAVGGKIGTNTNAFGDVISSGALNPITTPQFQIPQPIAPYPVSGLNAEIPEITATSQETKASDLTTRLQAINDQLIGKSAFRAQQETAQGLPDLLKSQIDLSSRLKALQSEALQIPQQLQLEATGRGITTGGLQPIQTAALRNNAIQALGVSSLLEATRGNITLAQDLADRAVEQKYGPLEEEQKAKLANLQLILDDPKTSLQDKNRANAQKAIENKKIAEIEKQKADEEAKNKILLEIALGGKANAQQLEAIRTAKDSIEAARLAQPFLAQATPQRETQIIEASGRKLLVDTQTGETIRDYGSSTPPVPVTTPDGSQAEFGTPDYIIGRLQQTANSKTKPVASEREQLGKFTNVVALTGSLMTSLNKTNTDPVFGYLKSLNPYDFDARAVNAQVIALVPSVARALYGEVGVLTDSDIERYLKTLPNIRSTEDQNKFIALMTLGNAKRSYEQTLLNLANSKVNVSGFQDSYRNIVSRVEKLESDLKIGEVQTSPEDEAIFDEVIGNQTGNYFSRLWNSILGR